MYPVSFVVIINFVMLAVAANWGQWGSWGGCSATCGGGRQQRIRRCVGGNTCVGANSQFRDCNTQNCPQRKLMDNYNVPFPLETL